MTDFYLVTLILALLLALGTLFLLVLLRVLEERRDVADTRISWAVRVLQGHEDDPEALAAASRSDAGDRAGRQT
ncbi:hypothetical protein [Pseudofrankia asymbiotica]|uniref:Uncharacterized protein n=1 Tax=Pseudofrankia asymbiotica TaxID=1834516 RepID=A0A1V2I127_9ACTN|nr:hypothetical protein [Pseudofrankia asymbiotica]ONH23198.1 hypothetical protein BL253_33630 [Pseudofrankia asymbiotica]